jgi:L-alanine-DL-glutamate epimerase-like enolase superfamily enzyme
MKILRTHCWKEEFNLTEPFRIAYETVDWCESVFLQAETDSKIVALGCAAPDPYITGETGETVLDNYGNVIESLLHRSDPSCYIRIMEDLKTALPGARSTHAMVDIMLYDLLARSAGVPLYKLLGGFRESIPTSITVGIRPLKETIEKVDKWHRSGFRIFKIKGGLNVSEDIEKMIRIRERFKNSVTLRFDANQGYTVADAIKFINGTRNAGVELFEQPTPRDEFEWLGTITRKTEMPVIADESLVSLKDAYRISKNELTDIINIKLMKVGGITEGMHINSVAKSAGIEVMIGCLEECSLGISAGLHFALSRPNITYADLDGHLDLQNDPTAGAITLIEGVLYPTGTPGLGFDYDS